MITLYQFPALWGLPNVSPFCLKVETYLRMAAIPYTVKTILDPRKAPKGKLPFIKVEGQVLADSELILYFLTRKFGEALNKQLTLVQNAESAFLESTFADRLYWFMVYFRWQDDAGWTQVKPAYFDHLPFMMKVFLPNYLRKRMIKTLYLQGTGRHNKEEITHMAEKTLGALANFLGLNNYFMGEEPSAIDATAFAFLANMVWFPFHDPLKEILQKHLNLREFCDRMWGNYFPEKEPPFSIIK